jgi:hypothetical protein
MHPAAYKRSSRKLSIAPVLQTYRTGAMRRLLEITLVISVRPIIN